LTSAAAELAGFYNDPHNAALLSNTVQLSADDVVQLWREAADDGARAFLLWRGGTLVGDCDFRHVAEGAAEVAILIGPTHLQGMGLGRRFAVMQLALGFDELGLERAYVAIRPFNAASLRLFGGIGFVRDDTPAGRAYAEDEDDVCMVLDRGTFVARHADALAEIERTTCS
jgi:RimJ/RimL family protein N-acetyltransferase